MLPGVAGVVVLCRPCNSSKGTGGAEEPDPGEGPPDPKGTGTRGLAAEVITHLDRSDEVERHVPHESGQGESRQNLRASCVAKGG